MRCGTHVYRGRHDGWACAGWASGIEMKTVWHVACCKLARLMDKYSKADIGRIEMDPKWLHHNVATLSLGELCWTTSSSLDFTCTNGFGPCLRIEFWVLILGGWIACPAPTVGLLSQRADVELRAFTFWRV
jgi:hypothetical protein